MAEQDTFSMDAYAQHAAKVSQHFEQRRKKFLKHFKMRALIAALLIATFPFWYSLITHWDNVDVGVTSFGLFIVHILAAIIILLLIIIFALRPVFRYRYDTLSMGSNIPNVSGASLPGVTGAVHQTVLLKSRIFTELLRYFGNFTMHELRKPPLRRLQKAPNLPAFDVYEASDYIKGVMHDVRVDMAETMLFTQHAGDTKRIFRGLFILIDINDTQTVLHGKFSGQTVLMLNHDASAELLLKKYDGYKRVQLPDSNFGQQVVACSTDLDEAQRLLTPEFIGTILKINEMLQNAKEQVSSADDRFITALERVTSGLGDMLAVFASAMVHWFRTGSFRQLSSRHDYSKSAAAIPKDGPLFATGVQCSFFDDKILISLPTRNNLFEPDSLFHPPLNEEDIQLSYNLMSGVSVLIQEALNSLPNEPIN